MIGIAGLGLYLPKKEMTAKEISEKTDGYWTEDAVTEKLGIKGKRIPGEEDGTQEMGARAALHALKDYDIDPMDIDVILCMGEEWKEYPLTTSALYIQDRIGAKNAWGIDLQNRCCTTVAAMKIAKDMLKADDDLQMIMVVGGYRNGDFVDYTDPNMSMMFNLSAGAGAIILKKGMEENLLLGSHLISDGSLSRDAGVEIGGINQPITQENINEAYHSLRLMRPKEMKDKLNAVSMDNWMTCIDKALDKSNLAIEAIDYVAILHIKRSMHEFMLTELGKTSDQSIYLEDYGHIGQVDQILSLKLALDENRIKAGSKILMIAAGIGYVWAANVIAWGK
jgi:3-oxoacyl-[acyl-carrier-protein] synthase-3